VERYLKALWLHERAEGPPRSHSLTELGDALDAPPDLRPRLVYLNTDFTAARYPDAANGVPYEVYDRPTAEAKVAAAEEVLERLRERTRG
jgi:HEPN domain-containing protein